MTLLCILFCYGEAPWGPSFFNCLFCYVFAPGPWFSADLSGMGIEIRMKWWEMEDGRGEGIPCMGWRLLVDFFFLGLAFCV